MTDDQTSDSHASEPSPVPEPPGARSGPSRTTLMVGGGVAGALLLGLAGFAVGTAVAGDDGNGDRGHYGSDDGDARMFGGQPGGMGDGDSGFAEGNPGGSGPMPGGAMSGGAILHGKTVIEDASGDVVTRLAQRGEVTDVSATAITVKSSDGFAADYVVDGDTLVRTADATDGGGQLDGIASGDTVSVLADVSGAQNTALMVSETP